MILITTSDYFPQLGGLTSFTFNIVKCLEELQIEYEVFHWKNFTEIKKFNANNLSKYKLIINVHPMFGWLCEGSHEKMINFVHGSEILMTSSNPLKKLIKFLNKEKYFKKMYNSRFNFFISEFTRNKVQSIGYKIDYSRDFVFHNNILIEADLQTEYVKENSEMIKLICVARNVPHKNIEGAIKLGELLKDSLKKEVELTLSPEINFKSDKISIKNLKDFTNETRSEAYIQSHFNLLLSKDHSSLGYFEGFGLTVLESGQYGTPSIVLKTGGLPEAVHHGQTGIVLNDISKEEIEKNKHFLTATGYKTLSQNSKSHTINHHSLENYQKLIKNILGDIE